MQSFGTTCILYTHTALYVYARTLHIATLYTHSYTHAHAYIT